MVQFSDLVSGLGSSVPDRNSLCTPLRHQRVKYHLELMSLGWVFSLGNPDSGYSLQVLTSLCTQRLYQKFGDGFKITFEFRCCKREMESGWLQRKVAPGSYPPQNSTELHVDFSRQNGIFMAAVCRSHCSLGKRKQEGVQEQMQLIL